MQSLSKKLPLATPSLYQIWQCTCYTQRPFSTTKFLNGPKAGSKTKKTSFRIKRIAPKRMSVKKNPTSAPYTTGMEIDTKTNQEIFQTKLVLHEGTLLPVRFLLSYSIVEYKNSLLYMCK